MHLLAERFVFRGWWLGFSERKSQDSSNVTNVASQLTSSFSVFTSIVFGQMWVYFSFQYEAGLSHFESWRLQQYDERRIENHVCKIWYSIVNWTHIRNYNSLFQRNVAKKWQRTHCSKHLLAALGRIIEQHWVIELFSRKKSWIFFFFTHQVLSSHSSSNLEECRRPCDRRTRCRPRPSSHARGWCQSEGAVRSGKTCPGGWWPGRRGRSTPNARSSESRCGSESRPCRGPTWEHVQEKRFTIRQWLDCCAAVKMVDFPCLFGNNIRIIFIIINILRLWIPSHF